jgi:hypothetical protein
MDTSPGNRLSYSVSRAEGGGAAHPRATSRDIRVDIIIGGGSVSGSGI